MHMQSLSGQRLRDVGRLVDPLRLNLQFGLGPVFTPCQSICFHPNLDRPVHLDLDALFLLHRNVSPRTHIDPTQDNAKSTNRSRSTGYWLTQSDHPSDRLRLSDNATFEG